MILVAMPILKTVVFVLVSAILFMSVAFKTVLGSN